MEAIINTASTGYSSHRPILLRSWRRTRRNIQTTSPNRTGGHTQLNPASTAADPLSETRPATAMNAAGAAAHRCGWSLNRVDSTASNAQPSANSTAPVSAFSLAGMNGMATRSTAAISPAAMDKATINPILLLAVGCAGPGCWRSPCRVAVVMIASALNNEPGATETVASVVLGASTVRRPDGEVHGKQLAEMTARWSLRVPDDWAEPVH